jgi:hypothetical protein
MVGSFFTLRRKEHPEKKKPTKYKLSKEAKTTKHHAQKAIDMMGEKLDVKLFL